MILTLLALSGCVEDVAKDKVEAIVEDVVEKVEKEAPPAAATGDAWMVDTSKSTVKALGAKITATHPIDFKDYEGKMMVDGDKITGVAFTVKMASLESDQPKLTKHLLTPDFFDVEQFPTSTFTSTAIKEGSDTEGMTHTVTGEFTIHGMTKQVTFPAMLKMKDGKAMARTEFALNRQDFGVTYPGKPDDLVQDNVVLTVELVAAKPAA